MWCGTVAEPTPALPERIAIIGLGLIGGLVARGLRARGHEGVLVGCVRTPADADRALALGLVDEAGTDAVAVAGADLVVVAVPIGAMADTLATIAPAPRRRPRSPMSAAPS